MSRGDWMQTYSGGRFYPLSPRSDEIKVGDIAHALSLLCRFGGHVDRFYSVAEHCVLMSRAVAPEHALAALLHDATEAYVVDVPRPLKRYLPEYSRIENLAWHAICDHFGISRTLPAGVHNADDRILIDEKRALLSSAERWPAEDTMEPLGVTIEAWAPGVAEVMYLSRLAELWSQR